MKEGKGKKGRGGRDVRWLGDLTLVIAEDPVWSPAPWLVVAHSLL